MLRAKRALLCILAMVALNVVSNSVAAAASPTWWVAGSKLAPGVKEALANTTKVAKAFAIEGDEGQIGVRCPTIQLEEASIEGESAAQEHAIIFKECTNLKSTGCQAPSTITTNPLKTSLEGKPGNFQLKFEATSGSTVATVTFSNCILGKVPITGSMACEYPGVETEAFLHELDFTLASGTKLSAVGMPITFVGDDVMWVASNKKWSAK